MTIALPEQPWEKDDTFTVDETGLVYTYDGEKWLAAATEEELDLSGYATKDQLDRLADESALTDNSIYNKIDEESAANTAAHAYLEAQLQVETNNRKDGDKHLQEQIDAIEQELGSVGEITATLNWVDYTYSGDTVDALSKQARVHPDRTKMSLNKDRIEGGYANWETLLAPYPSVIGMELGDTIHRVVVEYVGRAGQNDRAHNFKILEHNLPMEAQPEGTVVGIYPNYSDSPFITREESKADDQALSDRIDGLQTGLNQETIDRIKGDNALAADIEEIALILSTLAKSIESGYWSYIGDGIPRSEGEFALQFPDVTTEQNIVTFNEKDMDGKTHLLPNTVSEGDYLEIVDQEHPDDFGLWQVTKVPEGTGLFAVEVNLVQAGNTFDLGDKCEVRFFSVSDELDMNDLDARYLKLAGGTMTGKLTTPDIEVKTRDYTTASLYLHGHRDNANVSSAEIVMHNRYHAGAKGTISWEASTGNNGRFKFDDRVIFGKGQQVNTTGFTVKGYVSNSAPNGDLLYVYHNQNAQDSVLYKGKQTDDQDHLATTKWTVGKIETAIGNIEFPDPDLSDYVSKTGGDEMQGPFRITTNPEIEGSRNSRKIEVLNINSGTENSSLNLGAKNTSVYIGADQTTFIKPILVDDIGEKNEGHNVNFLNTTTAPRAEVKTGERASEAVMLLEGHRTGTSNPAARITMSNNENANAYGSLSWKGINGQGWFEFNKDVDLSGHGLHSVTRVRLNGDKAICDGSTERIKVGGKVEIKRVGANTDGFKIEGRVNGNNTAGLLVAYHNSGDTDDAVNYLGKQEADENLATVGYVKSQIGKIEIPEPDLDGYLPLDGSEAMTGALTAPRVSIKTPDYGDGVLLVEGKRDNSSAVSARVTFSNRYNSNAYGSIQWYASSSNNGYFKFTDRVKLAEEGTADNDLVTKAYVDSKSGGSKSLGSLATYKGRLLYQTNGGINNQFYFTDQYGAATTAQSQSKFLYWNIPNSCWVKKLTGNGVRDLGEVLIYNTSGTIMWTGSIITVQDPSTTTKIKIDTERLYGTNAWNNGSWYMVELIMAFREK